MKTRFWYFGSAAIIATCLLQGAALGRESDSVGAQELQRVQSLFQNVATRAGLHLFGEFRSQYLQSSLSGDSLPVATPRRETIGYTALDLGLTARPNDAIHGKVILRMHQDWVNLFRSSNTGFHPRWLSISGTCADMFSYDFGDFLTTESPYTIYAPEVTIPYEPRIFAIDGDLATSEEFIEDNKRLLQGIRLGFAARLKPLFDEISVTALGTRLRHPIIAYNNVVKLSEASDRERLALLFGADATFLRGLSLGATVLRIFDNEATMKRRVSNWLVAEEPVVKPTYATVEETFAEHRTIGEARGTADIAALALPTHMTLELGGRVAMMNDAPTMPFDSVQTADKVIHHRDTLSASVLAERTAKALRVDFKAGADGADRLLGFMVSASLTRNDKEFRNELAQSPTFAGRQVMNIEGAARYSTFDALYRTVFSSLYTSRDTASFRKGSYTQTVLSDVAMNGFSGDPALQLLMPFGPATPNRGGIDAKATIELLEKRVELTGSVANMAEISEPTVFDSLTAGKAELRGMGGGGRADVGSLIGFKHPILISGSFTRSTMSRGMPAWVDTTMSFTNAITSDFVNAGLTLKFWKRAALLAGFQRIETVSEGNFVTTTITQRNMGVGLEYRIADASYLIIKLARVEVDGDTEPGTDFKQVIPDMLLRVHF